MSAARAETAPLIPPAVVWLLCAISMMPAVSTDIMLPATGLIAAEYGVPEAFGGLLVGGFLLGYGFGQVVWGIASDAWGRRPIILMSLGAMTLAAAGCVVAPNFWVLLALRFVHGLCAGAPVVARAMTRDLGTGPQTVQLLSLLMATVSLGPLVAPVLGSALLVLFDWRACFVLLAVVGAVCWVLAFRMLPETLRVRRPERFSLGFVLPAGRNLLREREYLLGGSVIVLTFAGYGSVLALGAVVAEQAYGVTPEAFGAIFFVAAVCNAVGSVSMRWFGARFSLDGVMAVAVSVLALAICVQGAFLAFTPPLALFWGGICLYLLCFGAIMPSGMAIAMRPAGGMPGFAASFLGMLLMIGAFLGGSVATALHGTDHRAISLTMVIFGGAAVAVYGLHCLTGRRS
ncbi:MFS transporter [Rhodobacteraceae bacterium DSL-40]|uniref:MFS transporter n=1 Tax=Amaricoccus sp. B4 TaxID=3368557 RepID=UPI000DAB63D9